MYEGREINYPCEGATNHTPMEPWSLYRTPNGHWYNAQANFVKERLKGKGKCLVIGSPIFEALEIEEAGWDVTYLDVRKPPEAIRQFVVADATDIPLQAESFDAVSSTCVLCHVGHGRYDDPIVPDGDEKMLNGIARVLKPGGQAALMFGPTTNSVVDAIIRIGFHQRIYTITEALRMVKEAGLKVKHLAVYDTQEGKWQDYIPTCPRLDRFYLSAILEK